jgi:hypothetical protein
LSNDASIARWQQRLNGLQNVIGCGCHLIRPIPELIKNQHFTIDRLQSFYARRIPRDARLDHLRIGDQAVTYAG